MADASQQPTARFDVHLTSDSHFGWIRTRLAVERTLMAYLRTGVALIGFGFTIVQFFQRLGGMEGVAPASRPQAAHYLGLALIGAGILSLLISGWQYRHVVRYLWSPQFRALAGMETTTMKPVFEQSPLLLVVITVTLIGLFAFFAVLLRMV
jgi:putative membrane protein